MTIWELLKIFPPLWLIICTATAIWIGYKCWFMGSDLRKKCQTLKFELWKVVLHPFSCWSDDNLSVYVHQQGSLFSYAHVGKEGGIAFTLPIHMLSTNMKQRVASGWDVAGNSQVSDVEGRKWVVDQ